MTQPLVTLSIVSHGDYENLQKLLESVRKYEEEETLQIIITDNLGNDLPALDPFGWASLTVLRNPKEEGFARNHNRAFRHATGKYFCVLNPDIIFSQSIFPFLSKRLEEQDALISPLIFDSKNTLQDSFRQYPTPYRLFRRKLPGYRFTPLLPDKQGVIHPDWIAGMFLFLRSESYRLLGGFDEKFYLYFEDVDICARARGLGLPPLVDSRLRIQHNAQRTSRKNIRFFLWHLQSAFRFFTSDVYRKRMS
jgi:GT2 family glycosyltransferase